MKLTLVKEKDNVLLSRKRLSFEGESADKTPSILDLKAEVAKMTKAKEEVVVIRHVYTRFGSKNIKVIAHVYNTVEEMNRIEEKSAVLKNNPKAEAAEDEE